MDFNSLISKVRTELNIIEEKLLDPNLAKDRNEYIKVTKRHSFLKNILDSWDIYSKIESRYNEYHSIIEDNSDMDLVQICKEEMSSVESDIEKAKIDLIEKLIPDTNDDQKDAIMEIRSGTGGEEAALFAMELFRMYSRYTEKNNLKIEVLQTSPSSQGGLKEIIFEIKGRNAYKRFKYESGVHRVQRVPVTEAQGRLHTSAISVVVLPKVDEVDLEIKPDEIKFDIFRSSGPGGQSVNTTDSAVRVTHVPTGIVVVCQDERSQTQNKLRAMTILRSRLYDRKMQEEEKKLSNLRKSMIGSGDRSEKIRTYNFPQNRLTDHRTKITLYQLDYIIGGELDELIEHLNYEDKVKKLGELTKDGK